MNKPKWSVVSVIPRDDYTLLIKFSDGKKGIYDFKKDLECPLYERQRNIAFFMQAKAMYSSVVWPDDSDIAPEHLYEASTEIKA